MGWRANSTDLDGSTGLGIGSVELGTGGVDTAVIESIHDWDNNDFSYGNWVTVRQNSDVLLYGMVTAVEPYARAGGAQGRRYTISCPWWHLERTVYQQQFKYATGITSRATAWRSRVWLGTNNAGERVPTNVQIADILSYAASVANIDFGYSIGSFGVIAPVTEAVDQTCAALLMQILRWHPDVQVYWRYGSGSATLHMRPLSGLSGVSLDVSNASSTGPGPVQCSVFEREDQVPPKVVVKYERVNQFDDGLGGSSTLIEVNQDVAGAGSENAPGALVYTIELQGMKSTPLVQPVRTRPVPASGVLDASTVRWYQTQIPALKGVPSASLTAVAHTLILDTDLVDGGADPEDAPLPPPVGEPGDYPRELLEGTIQEWMTGIKATPMAARGKLKLTGDAPTDPEVVESLKKIFGETLDQEAVYYVRYTGTDATTRRYYGLGSFEAAEPWPEGLAAAVYQNLSNARYEGQVTVRDQECPVDVLPGMMLTLTGRSATGPVQQVSFDGNAGSATIRIGWPGHLAPQDIFERLRASRTNAVTATYHPQRRTDAQVASRGQSVAGALRTPRSDVQLLSSGGGAETHPFAPTITKVGEAWQSALAADSILFKSLDYTERAEIGSLTTPMAVATAGRQWLEIQYATWPNDYSVSIKSSAASGDWGDGEIEDDGADPPKQKFARLVIATFSMVGGKLVAKPLVRSHLRMKLINHGGLLAYYPTTFP